MNFFFQMSTPIHGQSKVTGVGKSTKTSKVWQTQFFNFTS